MRYGFLVKASEDVPVELLEEYEIPAGPVIYRGSEDKTDVARHFVESIVEVARKIESLMKTNIPIIMTEGEEKTHQECTEFYRIRSNPTVVNPKFSSFSSRFKTFKLFPSNTSQNKYTLSECGLKYSGLDDVVECFCCGLILHNWERLDDPWIEHCRFNPRCLYVLLMKGN
ncbi:putative inhibitor of apoptosis, partial [Acyrthosiphon pisum]|uniref:Uncharacterized protein n=1 Tax=Acyrthosiphon pisum TaxID=7029 RepID=A0A8R2BAL1_ACYPI